MPAAYRSYRRSPWWLLEGVEADDRTGQHGKGVEAFAAALMMSSKDKKDAEWARSSC
jgi:hypothetical protein